MVFLIAQFTGSLRWLSRREGRSFRAKPPNAYSLSGGASNFLIEAWIGWSSLWEISHVVEQHRPCTYMSACLEVPRLPDQLSHPRAVSKPSLRPLNPSCPIPLAIVSGPRKWHQGCWKGRRRTCFIRFCSRQSVRLLSRFMYLDWEKINLLNQLAKITFSNGRNNPWA